MTDWDFFLIHAEPDAGPAEELHRLLSATSSTFLDAKSISTGGNWMTEIPDALRGTRVFVVLLSDHTDSSHYAGEEIVTAVSLARQEPEHRKIVPVFLQGQERLVDRMPYGLRLRQGLDLAECGGMKGVAERLLQVLPAAAPSSLQAPGAPAHPLQDYPTYPLVPAHLVNSTLIRAFARFLRPTESKQVIADANAFRRECPQEGQRMTTIEPTHLPPPASVTPMDYWHEAFSEARKHGPRMLAALVLTVEDGQFDRAARVARERLLSALRLGEDAWEAS